MKITLKGGNSQVLETGQTVGAALKACGLSIGSDVLAAKVNGVVVDLSRPLTEDAVVEPVRFDTAEGR
ncbi:MAG: TGS domain-containing protein, partial [Pseudohongiella sp.]|nr:TGS domain-containing protein [Pseudohongiella sp.]